MNRATYVIFNMPGKDTTLCFSVENPTNFCGGGYLNMFDVHTTPSDAYINHLIKTRTNYPANKVPDTKDQYYGIGVLNSNILPKKYNLNSLLFLAWESTYSSIHYIENITKYDPEVYKTNIEELLKRAKAKLTHFKTHGGCLTFNFVVPKNWSHILNSFKETCTVKNGYTWSEVPVINCNSGNNCIHITISLDVNYIKL